MKIAWVSPLPPSPSGIGDYSADLLPEVAKLVPTTAFTTEPEWRPEEPQTDLEVRPYDELEHFLRRDQDLIPVYHQGNNPFHAFVYELAVRFPGVFVLHDVVLHHFLLERADRTGDWGQYLSLLEEQYPAAASSLYDLRRAQVATDLEKFLFPLSGPVIKRSLLTVVHSRYAAEIARMEWSLGTYAVIPHHSGRRPASFTMSRDEVRSKLGIDGDSPLIGSFGYITIPKQGDVLLEAFARVIRAGAQAVLLFAGPDQQGGGLESLARDLGMRDRVRFAGHLARDDFYSFLNATDIVVSLRYPSAGETSGTLSRALSLGRCVVVPEYASFVEIPSDACVHVTCYSDTVRELADRLQRLIDDDDLRLSLGEGARRYAESELSLTSCALKYVRVAEEAVAAVRAPAGCGQSPVGA